MTQVSDAEQSAPAVNHRATHGRRPAAVSADTPEPAGLRASSAFPATGPEALIRPSGTFTSN
ncbi:hypothetical protein ACFUN8_35480 [Streptomyces sp. NPDC057307]|uniref:hypothetical protein n=1 Tax=Streptomyces sp. NPDC057307 TaxID=3346096 RepID=UPI0036295112